MKTASTEIRESKKEKLSEAEKEIRQLETAYARQSDRNLLEKQTSLLEESTKNLESIRDNVRFFFWITIIGMGIWVVIYLAAAGAFD